MLLMVPIFMSFTGRFTVTRPFLVGCLNCLCEPDCATSTQPSSASFLITSRLLIGIDPAPAVCIIYTSSGPHSRALPYAIYGAWHDPGRYGTSVPLRRPAG